MMTTCVRVLLGGAVWAGAVHGETGPTATRFTTADMLNALDLSRPELGPIKQALDAGDIPTAQRAFVVYLKSRPTPTWHFDWRSRPKHTTRPAGVNTARAEEVARNIIVTVDVTHDYGTEIDWFLNPTHNKYNEYVWQLSRHAFWEDLRRAYWDTGDETYARAFVRQLVGWIDHCPRPANSGNHPDSAWRTIEAGIRMSGSWPNAFFGFLSSPSFDDAAICRMVGSMVEHARHLLRYPTRANWLTMESNGLFHVGVLFPEFKEAATWRDTALQRLRHELDAQVYPDGAQMELSTGYHQVALRNFVAPVHLARLNGIALPEGYVSRLERMYHYNLYAARPDLRLPDLNDGGHSDVAASCRQALEFFPTRRDFEWAATHRKKGTPPSPTGYVFPYAGHVIMRTGWGPDDAYLLFDVGPFGIGHQHEDKLHFVLFAHGRELIIDPGNYPYDSSQWRRYHIGSYAHNVVHVDGEPQNRRRIASEVGAVTKPLPLEWKTDAKYDYASAVYDDGFGRDGRKLASHRREILFVKPDYWVVVDTLRPREAGAHEYEAFFHTDASPDQAVLDPNTGIFRTRFDGGNIAMAPVAGQDVRGRIVAGQEQPYVQGWVRCGAYEVRPAATAVFTKRAAGVVTMAYVLHAFKGPTVPVHAVETLDLPTATPQAWGLRLKFTNGRAHVIVRLEDREARSTWSGREVRDRFTIWSIDRPDAAPGLLLTVPW